MGRAGVMPRYELTAWIDRAVAHPRRCKPLRDVDKRRIESEFKRKLKQLKEKA